MDSFLLVDSYAQIYRAYYAVRALSNRKGFPTNAIFGMAKFLLKLDKDFPEYQGAFVFDWGKPQHRLELAPQYKAQRPPMPEDLRPQIEVIRELVTAFGWSSLLSENWEADDLIAASADYLKPHPVRIISADKDLAQLIDERVTMLVPDPDGKGFSIRNIAAVVEKFGVPPAEIVDYLAMLGDASDNIPGIEGVGPKTAVSLMAQFHSIENMLAHTDEIARENLRLKIQSGADILRTNIKLVTLVHTLPAGCTLNESSFKRTAPDYGHIRDIAERMELRSILKELPLSSSILQIPPTQTPPDTPSKSNLEQPSLF